MSIARMQRIGTSAVLAVPDDLLEQAQIAPDAAVEISVEGRSLVVREQHERGARRHRYSLDELLAQCAPDAFERTPEDEAWLQGGPVGHELL